eukprot:CFRG6351T1
MTHVSHVSKVCVPSYEETKPVRRYLKFKKRKGAVLGASLCKINRRFYVTDIRDNSLAWRLGLEHGDRVDEVNDKPMSALAPLEFLELFRNVDAVELLVCSRPLQLYIELGEKGLSTSLAQSQTHPCAQTRTQTHVDAGTDVNTSTRTPLVNRLPGLANSSRAPQNINSISKSEQTEAPSQSWRHSPSRSTTRTDHHTTVFTSTQITQEPGTSISTMQGRRQYRSDRENGSDETLHARTSYAANDAVCVSENTESPTEYSCRMWCCWLFGGWGESIMGKVDDERLLPTGSTDQEESGNHGDAYAEENPNVHTTSLLKYDAKCENNDSLDEEIGDGESVDGLFCTPAPTSPPPPPPPPPRLGLVYMNGQVQEVEDMLADECVTRPCAAPRTGDVIHDIDGVDMLGKTDAHVMLQLCSAMLAKRRADVSFFPPVLAQEITVARLTRKR